MQVGCVVFVLACCLCGDAGASHVLRTSQDRELGQQMGELIRGADQRAAGGASPMFHESIVDTLNNEDIEGLVNPAVSEVVAEANNLAAHAVAQPDVLCVRNWSQPCPDGWSLQSHATCLAPPSYAGPCKQLQSFDSSNLLDKHKFASSCKSPWPCDDSCTEGHDYGSCPKGWLESGGGFCNSLAMASDTPQCMSEYKFDEMSIQEKQEMGSICGWEWMCKKSCLQDYSKQCPEEWSELPGLCVAPPSYAGDCGYSINTTGMSDDQKRMFAAKCVAAFPCRGEGETSMPVGSNTASSGGMGDGPLDSGAEPVKSSPWVSRTVDRSNRFAPRLVMPSGPVDDMGDVHF